MKVRLLHPDRDFDREGKPPVEVAAMVQDLEIEVILQAMAGKDDLVLDVCRKVALGGLGESPQTALYRQALLRDALAHPEVVRDLYALAHETIERRRKSWYGIFAHYASSILSGSVDAMRMLAQQLLELRSLTERHAASVQSEALRNLFARLQEELTDDYLGEVAIHLAQLKFGQGVLESLQLGPGCSLRGHTLRRYADPAGPWLRRWRGLLAWLRGEPLSAFSFRLHPRDEGGARILTDLRDRGINEVANALSQSADHVLQFFEQLRAELAFYVGCLNLRELLGERADICFPEPSSERAYGQLRDVSLLLSTQANVLGNDVGAGARRLVVITGANQGGKSSFLRSVGQAQLMMQCGMFVCASQMKAPFATGVFTHYRREEDTTMRSGKFDDELVRMEAIAQHLKAGALLLFNESFSATNEREGAEVASGIVEALLEAKATVVFVTHMFTLADGLRRRYGDGALFLLAPRLADGSRPFKLVEAPAQETSHGEDLYRSIFGDHRVSENVAVAQRPIGRNKERP